MTGRVSSFCHSGGCVQVSAPGPDRIEVRRSQDDGRGPVLVFDAAEWDAFLAGVGVGEFDVEVLRRPQDGRRRDSGPGAGTDKAGTGEGE